METSSPLDPIFQETDAKMQATIETTLLQFDSLRTNKAHSGMFQGLKVSLSSAPMELTHLGNFTTPDARTLIFKPHESYLRSDKKLLEKITKAILTSDTGVTPSVQGNAIWCPLPELTTERRQKLCKVAQAKAHEGHVSIRVIRQKAMEKFKALEKDKVINPSDQERNDFKTRIEASTKKFNDLIDQHLASKQAALMPPDLPAYDPAKKGKKKRSALEKLKKKHKL